MIQNISAVTFAVRDMAPSIEFYGKLGFELQYGGARAAFTSFKAGDAFVNLIAKPGYERQWWGRAIFRVDDVDEHYRSSQAHGLRAEPPRDHLGASASFTSLIRTGTSLALRSS
jgi:catechol 2,3-dioxygenase-like lactoylglutathione lyase family enzyme